MNTIECLSAIFKFISLKAQNFNDIFSWLLYLLICNNTTQHTVNTIERNYQASLHA